MNIDLIRRAALAWGLKEGVLGGRKAYLAFRVEQLHTTARVVMVDGVVIALFVVTHIEHGAGW